MCRDDNDYPQGFQIFLGTTYQKGKKPNEQKYTIMQNGHKIYQIDVK
jgi:hypothetical protein